MPQKSRSKRPIKKLFSHHRHTGKLLPREHTSYPILMLLLLMTGALLGYTTLQARAATITVTAVANGPLPLGPAIITNPKNGDRFSEMPIAVSGTCPYPYFVKLFRNQTFSGSTQCKSDGTFLIYTDLFVGKNELEARIYNAADQEGPRSPIVTVYYDPPTPSTPPASPGEGQPTDEDQPPSALLEPFFITTDLYFKAVYDEEKVEWKFGIVGGNKPFHVTVAWGDGGTSTQNNLKKDNFSVTHRYTRGPETREFYPVSVSVTDVNGRQATLQVFTILNNRLIPGLGRAGPDQQEPENALRWLLMAWPIYGVTLLMAISFWLGEHRGLMLWSRTARRFKGNKLKPHRA